MCHWCRSRSGLPWALLIFSWELNQNNLAPGAGYPVIEVEGLPMTIFTLFIHWLAWGLGYESQGWTRLFSNFGKEVQTPVLFWAALQDGISANEVGSLGAKLKRVWLAVMVLCCVGPILSGGEGPCTIYTMWTVTALLLGRTLAPITSQPGTVDCCIDSRETISAAIDTWGPQKNV